MRQPLLEELRLMSQELRAGKDLAVAQSRRNAQLQREARAQVRSVRCDDYHH